MQTTANSDQSGVGMTNQVSGNIGPSDSYLPSTPTNSTGIAGGPPLAQLAQKLSTWKGEALDASQNQPVPGRDSFVAEAPTPLMRDSNFSSVAAVVQPTISSSITSSSSFPIASSDQSGSVAQSVPVSFSAPSIASAVPAPPLPVGDTQAKAGLAPQQMGPVVIHGSASGKTYPYTIEDLLQLVVDKSASDLHITTNYPAMVRIDGDLVPVGNELITDEIVNDIVLPVLPESKQELLEVNREVDLAYSFKGQARFRINAFYSKGTVSAAFRLIPNKIRTIEELKLPGTFHQLTRLPQGLVLITGPTGHGKSTTLAAVIQEINETYPKHIITIEDPIEYVYPKARALVAQREMHEDTHSWEIALRSAMREDPNVILVGEMRDYETIAAAITLAETGHLVFATLHTNSAAQTIDRIIDVFPEHQQPQVRMQVSVILEAIISQRLIPVKSGGRRAVSEVLFATGAVRNLIREGKTHQIDNVIRTSLDVGMKTLEHSLVELVREGELTIDEAESVALHPEEMLRLLRA